ncbi:MAG: TatD family hydrolase [Bacteroidetes bacterium]|nr:TatD family hydrolase [Bacteroidota bacterium]
MDSSIQYSNIHTHNIPAPDEVAIYNVKNNVITDKHYFVSLGLHPWYIDKTNVIDEINSIRKYASEKNILAIGECGLDKLIDTDLEVQEKIFKEQILIAETVRKPLIIHCVKAFDSLIRIKKEMKVSVPMIIHGYNNNEQITQQLLNNNFYFSFGKALLKEDSNASKIISKIPLEQMFFETDDQDIPVKSIFERASYYLQTDLILLKEQINNNFKRIFRYE